MSLSKTRMPTSLRDRVSVSYSRLDRDWLDRLRQVLAPDLRNERIDYWDDRQSAIDSWLRSISCCATCPVHTRHVGSFTKEFWSKLAEGGEDLCLAAPHRFKQPRVVING